MAAKRPTSLSQMFAGAQQSQEVLTLKDRVAELEDEIAQLRTTATTTEDRAYLEQQIEELTQQLAERGGVHEVPIEKIRPDPDQPRTIFPQAVIDARAKSLREDGQLTPVILIPLDDGEYQLFEGALRHLAAPLAGLTHLKAVLRQESEDPIEVFERQLATSIQSEKLHGLDLANALVRLIVYRFPELQHNVNEIPNFLNAAIQRLKRSRLLAELEKLQTATAEEQQQWLDLADLRQSERCILSVILGKQLNPASVNTNIFPLLKLPEDVQASMRQGLEASKARELAKLSSERLKISAEQAIAIRQGLAQDAIAQQWSLSTLRQKIQDAMQQCIPIMPVASKLSKTIQKVQSLKIEPDEELDQYQLKLLETVLQDKLKQVKGLLQSLDIE